MKIAILSDAHGNYPALQAVLEDLEDFQPDKIVFAGDFTRGPFPNEVIETLRERNVCMIRGNDDGHILRLTGGETPAAWHTFKQFGMFRWTAKQLRAENLAFLRGLPEQTTLAMPGVDAIRVVHGTPRSPFELMEPDRYPEGFASALAMVAEPVLVCGHTHRQLIWRGGGKLVVNPGAVTGTAVGPNAQYSRLCWDEAGWQAELRTVAYDSEALQRAFVERGLLAEGGPMARGFLLSMLRHEDVMIAFMHHAYELVERGCEVIPDDVWERAEQTFDWG